METNELATTESTAPDLAAIYERELAEAVKESGCDLPTFFLGKLATYDALREKIKQQADALIGHINTQDRGLKFALGAAFHRAVEADLAKQGGKKKSVDYLTGRAGYRTTPARLSILDEPALKEWCIDHCKDALEVRIARTTPIAEYITKTGDIPPGAHWKAADEKFYPAFTGNALPEGGVE